MSKMSLEEVIKHLAPETAIAILLKIVEEYPAIREQLILVFTEHFKGKS